jgi:tRNA G18 (ribose-2'-O)-methylase SpoU
MKEVFCVILHNIRSAFNVGSIFRTADAVGVDKIFLTGYTPTPDKNKEIAKTALGAENFVKWEKYESFSYLLKKFKNNADLCGFDTRINADNNDADLRGNKYHPNYNRMGVKITDKFNTQINADRKYKGKYYLVGVEQAENSIPFYKFKPKFPLVLILGNEVRGLDKRILKKVDKIVEIPMFGKKESLNVAVTFGIIAYCVKINKYGRV